ncbi:hypothetical protein C0U44_32295, partial [Klebsiella pneumoniae]
GEPMYDRELGCNGLLLIGNTVPIRSQGAVVGAICTFRGEPMYDRELGCNGLLLIGNTVPIRSQGAVVGA